ncbi:MAG: hypothetical protein ABI230_09205 [Aestuariivirga sp.]
MGLNAFGGASFTQQWVSSTGGLSTASEQEFSDAVGRFSTIEYVQMCPEIHAGMTPEQTNSALLNSRNCITNIFPDFK